VLEYQAEQNRFLHPGRQLTKKGKKTAWPQHSLAQPVRALAPTHRYLCGKWLEFSGAWFEVLAVPALVVAVLQQPSWIEFSSLPDVCQMA
jgi:hypothetical protein